MLAPALRSARRSLALGATAAAAAGCGVSSPNASSPGVAPDPFSVALTPAVLHDGQAGELVIRSPGADSIVFESRNGLDRYWTRGAELRVTIAPDFGDAAPVARYAERHHSGAVLDLLSKPARIGVCRRGRCTEHSYDIPVRLPERNRRSVALAAGWSSVFARRSILGNDRTVLFREVLTSGIWSAQGEWARGRWNARAQAYAGGGEHGGSLDVSRMLMGGDGMSYGLTVHGDLTRSDWLGQGAGAPGRSAYRVGIGPSVMLKGITASSLLGLYSDGVETLQISSTRISVNGNLTSVRHPVTVTAEKTFAFGGGAIISRRRDALERLTAAVRLVENLAVNVGVSSHRLAWPKEHPSEDLRGSETVITLGGQYSVTW